MPRLATLTPFPMTALVLALSGCALHLPLPDFVFGERNIDRPGPTVGKTLKKLQGVPESDETLQEPDPEEVLALYRSVLDQLRSKKQNHFVARRIAELEMEQAELALIEGVVEAPYKTAIQSLERLLLEEQSARELTLIRYQLAHAYDQSGEPAKSLQHLNETIAGSEESDFVLEALFRRGEINFSAERHLEAALDYGVVSQAKGKYQLHAFYMLGWARFKQGDLDRALTAFVSAIEYILGNAQAQQRPGSYKELLTDVTRISVITLDYLDGVETLAITMANADKPEWQVHLYQALGDWYRDKGRFQDSADTWITFIARNPFDLQAPRISLEIIETYRDAGFISEIEPLKGDFIERYDKSSEFYSRHGDESFSTYQQPLLDFLDESTARAHARAQETQVEADFLTAAARYERWLVNFSGHERSGEIQFLLAEALSDGGAIQASIHAYRKVVYLYHEFERSRESAYAIVLGLESLSPGTIGSMSQEMSQEKLYASLYFANTYPLDIRVPAIRVNTAKMLFDLSRFQEAAELAQIVIDAADTVKAATDKTQETATVELLRTAVLISGHSRFELGEYALAEVAYRELLETNSADKELRERLLASVFKQAEKSEASGDIQQTIWHFQRLSEIDRMSPLAIDASYDVAGFYEQLHDYASAARQLEDFRQKYPAHPVVADIPKRLVSLYESMSMPGPAARELLAMHASQNFDRETQRQALYRAAELFLVANNTEMALDTFRNYAHKFQSPFGVRMEAMQQMDTLYQLKGESQKRRFWLRKKVDAFNRAGPEQHNDRTRFLAADAAFILAADKLAQFEAARLKLPLNRSLKKKSKMMKQTVKAFEQVADYGVAVFVSGSTFQVGSVYQSLAKSIIDSDRPPNLNELELEQYEILLEEQAFPFEEQAISIHKANLEQGWSIGWDDWVDASLRELDELYPGRFRRTELGVAYVKSLY